jgi:hypothetical protein
LVTPRLEKTPLINDPKYSTNEVTIGDLRAVLLYQSGVFFEAGVGQTISQNSVIIEVQRHG